MNETIDMNARVVANNRLQTLRAMERVVTHLGGKNAYVKWLLALPGNATLSEIGALSANALETISKDEDAFLAVKHEFAAIMGPVLSEMAE